MEIIRVTENKKQFLDLLLLADEQENMIDRYLERGDLFVLYSGDVKSACVVTKESDGVYEIKNLATYVQYQKQGWASRLLDYLYQVYKPDCKILYVGTGENACTISFYQHRGFIMSHKVKNFFVDNYDHPIVECDVQLVDMVYLKKVF